MKVFLDTSVLVATFYADHEHHEASIDLFLRYNRSEACCGAHSLAEVYAVLTGMPAPRRVTGSAALLFIGNIQERLTLIALDDREYHHVVVTSSEAGLSGGAIYDAILGHCALKAKAEMLYTWNTRDFLRLPPAIASRVKNP